MERGVCHEGATRRTVDVRGDRPGAAGHSTLATPRLCNSFSARILLTLPQGREVGFSYEFATRIVSSFLLGVYENNAESYV